MAGTNNMVILEEDYTRLVALMDQLREESRARLGFLLDRAGQQIVACGDTDGIDATSLSSLTAGSMAATDGLAELIGEEGFSTLYHEGKRDSLFISSVGDTLILLVIFDERSSLGLVRLRVDEYASRLAAVVDEVVARTDGAAPALASSASLNEITDDAIDKLFG